MKIALAGAAALCALIAGIDATVACAQTRGHLVRANVGASGEESEGVAGQAAVSADGRFVAFHSDAADLVPNDTNGDSDVFVRDRTTDVLTRVSVASTGMEARGDSTCPSISADGRFVAFLSRASNLVPGNPSPYWIVYVHDRRDGSTAAAGHAPDGARPDRNSGCPSISGDGQRIVFSSHATNLVPADGNRTIDVFLHDRATGATTRVSERFGGGDADDASVRARISRNGRFVAFESYALDLLRPADRPPPPRTDEDPRLQVYVRDLEAGVTEMVSVASAHRLQGPDGVSLMASISDDGNRIAFRSEARNLAPLPDGELDAIFVRDRAARRTWLASPADPLQSDCGRPGTTVRCKSGAKGPPAISGDGRFVAFSSRSLLHLPANQYSGDQIYLFDNLGRRLRRLSVDATGAEGEACSWEPSLSADGRVLAWASKSANLVPDDDGLDVDVFAQQRSCDASGECRPLAACPAVPLATCAAAGSSLLRLEKRPPGGINQDDLFWRFAGPASGDAFPDPSGDASYQLCVYADGLALDVAAPPAGRCSSAERPCWRAFGSGYELLDPEGGLTSVTLSRGAESQRVHVRGRGELLDAPYLPLRGGKGVVVQLHETGSGRCWGSTFPADTITRNVGGVAAPGSRRDGLLLAVLR